MSFLGEIKRRKVFQVAAVYAVVAWLTIQIVDVVSAPLGLPGWLDSVVIILLAVGFPIAVILAWAFDLTPQGVVPASDSSADQVPATPAVNRFAYISQGLVLVAVSFLVFDQYMLGALDSSSPEAPRLVTRALITPPETMPLSVQAFGNSLAISPDGTHVVYRGLVDNTNALLIRDLAEFEVNSISHVNGEVRELAISPDSNWIVFFDNNRLYRVSISGGPVVTIVENFDGFPRGVTWGPDDAIIFATAGATGLQRVAAGGGEVETLTVIDMPGIANHIHPEYLPGGDAVLLTLATEDASPDSYQIAVLSLDDLELKVLIAGGTDPSYVPTGHIVYGSGDTLRAVGFDLDRLEVTTDPIPVVNEVYEGGNGGARFSVSENGSLVYVRGAAPEVNRRSLVWIDRDGREEPLTLASGAYFWPRVSPDGTRIALSVLANPGDQDVWVFELARRTLSRITAGQNSRAIWTPDGERLVFESLREQDGRRRFFQRRADGTGEAEQLLTSQATAGQFKPYDWSPDGSLMVFDYGQQPTLDIGVLAVGGDEQWEPLLDSAANEAAPAISPDGNWIAYSSDRTGRCEIYVEQFPGLGNRRQISSIGGAEALWSPDGNELFYIDPSGNLMSVAIDYAGGFSPASPELLVDGVDRGIAGPPCANRNYDISPDGERFVFLRREDGAGQTEDEPDLVLVQNWFDELERLVPTD